MTPLNVLLVEDSPDSCAIALAYLEDMPYRVEIAEDGEVACRMFKAGRYDVVLMDRQMPVMDGLTATRAIRAWEKSNDRAQTPIIALTASTLPEDREQCLTAGCTAFLSKPIRQEVLLATLKEHTPNTSSRERAGAGAPIYRTQVHARLQARVAGFLHKCRLDVATMTDALTRSDLAAIERLGHMMSGTGASFGYEGIGAIGAALEEEALRKDYEGIQGSIAALSAFLDRVDLAVALGDR